MPIRVPSRTATPTHLLQLLLPLIQLLLLLATMLTLAAATSHCPALCECKWMNGKESVRCHSANLTEIPPLLDAGTQVLDLQRNEISRLDGDEFSIVNLLNLQKIFLVDCQLTSLHRFAFRNLINLVELDLSDNRLAAVPSHVFDSMAELRELRLSGNPVLRLEHGAFNGLAHLVRLELSNCRIRRVELRAFEGVRQSLEWLKLDGNELVNVQPPALTILNNLHGIELTRNNWNCTCSLRPLRLWMLQQNIPYESSPLCAYPERLKGRPWSRVDVDEFACAPLLVPLVSSGNNAGGGGATVVTVKAIEGQNVTIGCGIVAGNPDPTIRWMFRNRVIVGNVSLRGSSGTLPSSATSVASSSSSSSSSSPAGPPEGGARSSSSVAAITTLDTRKKFYHHLGRSATNVTIAWIDSHDAGLYKCIGENGAGRSEASVSVLVYSRHYLIDSNNNVIEASVALAHSNNRFIFIISTVVAALFVVLSLLLAICYYTVHRKTSRANAAHRHHHHQHQRVAGSASPAHEPVGDDQQPRKKKKKVLNKRSLNFLLCQGGLRSESYEKIEMLATMQPHTTTTTSGAGRRAMDETSGKIYCHHDDDEAEDEDGEPETEDGDCDVVAGRSSRGQLSPKSVRDKRRRTMSLNLSSSPASVQRKRPLQTQPGRRDHGEYLNVPTTADEEDSSGQGKLMATAGAATKDLKLFTKHQAQVRDKREAAQQRQAKGFL